MSYEILNIPDKCVGCATQSDIINKIAAVLLEKNNLTMIGESLIGEPGERHQEVLHRLYEDDEAEVILLGTRKIVGNSLDENDLALNSLIRQSQEYSEECSGTSKIRLTNGDVTYTVGICSAGSVYKDDEGLPAILHLTVIADEAQ